MPYTECILQVELNRIQRLLDTQSEQLQAALVSGNQLSPERTLDDASAQANPSNIGRENTQDKLVLAGQEINRLKQLLQEWKKYGNDWKRDGQMARVRASELQRREDELTAQVKTAEESKASKDAEIKRLTSALADQTVCSLYFLRHAATPTSYLIH